MPETDVRLRTCYDCGESFTDNYLAAGGSEWWNHFTSCDQYGCGEMYCPTNDTCTYCNGHGYDADDFEDEDVSSGGVYSYDYKPEPMWLGGPGKPYYLGFELEISAESYDVSPIYEWCADTGVPGMLYCKEDGSVNGFEIVSHPMTPEFFDSVDWSDFFTMLERHWPMGRYEEPTGHGLHVHVSRTAFPHQSTLARWSYLLNKYENHVNRVARRTSSRWAQFTPWPVSMLLPYERARSNGRWIDGEALACGCCYERIWREDPLSGRICHQFQTRGYPERYQAVNLTNRHTVEVRVFRSTRKPEEFTAALHFVAATVEFVRTMQPWHATRESVAWDRFADYVVSHPVFSKQSEVIAGITKPPESATLPARTVREWARAAGIPVGRRGRIPSEIQRAYLAASAI